MSAAEHARSLPEPSQEVALTAVRAVDEPAFAELVERHRAEIRVHCYRMLGSFEESEDLTQETFLRAWKNLDGFEGRSSLRAWLYKIATNACLDYLDGRMRRVLPHQVAGPSGPDIEQPARTDLPWLQPFPEHWSDLAQEQPDAVVVARETIELAFLAAIQHLPPRQRAVLILRDVLGWPARDTAAQLGVSVASANSALQRARLTMKEQLPSDRGDWAPSVKPTQQEQLVLRRYMSAVERTDLSAVASLLADEVRSTMPPFPTWFAGKQAVLGALAASWDPRGRAYVGTFRMLATVANRQPAAAAYVRAVGASDYQAFAIAVLSIADDKITEITGFHDRTLFPAFGLPQTLAAD